MVEEGIYRAIRRAAIRLPSDVQKALEAALERETSPMARSVLEAILRNLRAAEERGLPICQDTGTPTFYVELGEGFPLKAGLREAIVSAVRRATEEVPLRPNAVNPWTNENSGDNTGRGVPIIHWDVVEGDALRVRYLAKGGGSENVSALYMLSPSKGISGIEGAVIDAALRAGPKPCPPVIVGVGVGGGADAALKAAKRATMRPLGTKNPDSTVAELEERLLEEINSLGMGPMGLGGRTYALGVHVEWLHRHPASLPVGVSMICWAARRALVEFRPDGSYEILEP